MRYKEAIRFLFDQLPMFQRTGAAAYKNNLDNTLKLDRYFNHPHQQFKTVHVAGTNGKGSVSHMIASVLQEAGYRTGLYTSPHMKDFRERIRINGQVIPKSFVTRFVDDYNDLIKEISPSFFEMTVALAFNYFEKQKVDIAVIEVGLGGRLDSTNIITPELSIITNIGMDHMAFLGNTLPEIAREKAGIIKKEVPVVIGRYQKEIMDVYFDIAETCGATVILADSVFSVNYIETVNGFQHLDVFKNGVKYLDGVKLPLLGKYQLINLQTVCSALDQLNTSGFNISDKEISEGIKKVITNTGLAGRWHVIGSSPLIICDTGHNVDGIREVVKQIDETPYQKLHMVIGFVNDKAIDEMLKLLPFEAIYYFTKADIPRSLDENLLQTKAGYYGLKGFSYPTVKRAVKAAIKNAKVNDLIFIGGSTFVVAEAI